MNNSYENLERKIALFRNILETYIQPLTYRSDLSGPYTDAVAPLQKVVYDSQHRLKIFLSKKSRIYFLMKRKLPFGMHEKALIEDIVTMLLEKSSNRGLPEIEAAQKVIELAASRFMNERHAGLIFQLIQIYKKWARRSLEQGIFTHTLGIYLNKSSKKECCFLQLSEEEGIQNMGSGNDTLLAIDSKGKVLGVETISFSSGSARKLQEAFAPISVADVAMWTGTRNKIAIMLTERGEILLFRNRKLVFACYFSQWQFFPHKHLMDEIFEKHCSKEEMDVRKAVYLTSLDVAFHGKKASIGILAQPYRRKKQLEQIYAFRPGAISKNKTALIAAVVNNKKFQSLPREIRAELCSMAGVLILDTAGDFFIEATGRSRQSSASGINSEKDIGIRTNGLGMLEIYKNKDIPLVFA